MIMYLMMLVLYRQLKNKKPTMKAMMKVKNVTHVGNIGSVILHRIKLQVMLNIRIYLFQQLIIYEMPMSLKCFYVWIDLFYVLDRQERVKH